MSPIIKYRTVESIDSSILKSMFRNTCFLSLNIGQWRRKSEFISTLEPQLLSRFKKIWKLKLNLWSLNWINSRRSREICIIPLRLQQLKKLFGLGLINSRILFLKIPKFSELRRSNSSLFYSIFVDRKTNVVLDIKSGILPVFIVTYVDTFSGIKLKRNCGILLLKTL